MKQRILLGLCICLLVLTACGAPAAEPAPAEQKEIVGTPVETPVEQPAAEAPAEEKTPAEEPAPVEETPAEEPEEPAGPTVEDALAFVDQPVKSLKEALGEPLESYYEYSCSGPGDDGILTYDGFLVFTYREPDGVTETVIDAEAE